MPAPSILFVCLGNICRSPLAEGIYRHLTIRTSEKPVIASAGIGNWHIGNPPDRRSIKVAASHGIDISRQRARQVKAEDFRLFDFILAMDQSNLVRLETLRPENATARLQLFADFALGTNQDVPDPYYGDLADFEDVYSMLFSGCNAVVSRFA
ncbi:low molecular weight phosphotyrosine protein phosphatase [Rhizobium sp. AQ_MP]|uniref:low molecular weight protein-tyrosine-phosphatase n=1 Tax=Rhizobium sp. AQ_MP TaxID=2761536 RepID=UPI0013A5AEFE|nr:low molecular weight protein-tyrosine-phosphatase [Rhizobium sp. AQ_MP]MBC2772616.1 low molecular weight phosphotyrosine protein phosphatase [Rhizobium sp. AQ_MP]